MTSSSIDVGADVSFGPRFHHRFDFTLKFEHTILSILPSALLILALPVFFWTWYRTAVRCRAGLLLVLKAVVAVALIGLNAALAALWTKNTQRHSSSAVAAASLSVVSALCLGAGLVLEHRHTLRSSAFISLWLIWTILCDVVISRSAFLRPDLHGVGVLTAVSGGLKLLVLSLEEVSKNSLIIDEITRNNVGSECTSGFVGRCLFTWINSLFFLGFRNILSADHLKSLGPDFASRHLSEKLSLFWRSEADDESHSLMWAAFRALQSDFLWIAFPRLCYSIAKLSQSGLIYLVIQFIDNNDKAVYKKAGLMIAAAIVYSCLAITRISYEHQNYQVGVKLSVMLHSEVYKKSLRLAQAEAQKSAAQSLLGTDTRSIVSYMPYFHDLWACTFEILACIALLAILVKKTAVLIVIPGVVIAITAHVVGKHMPAAKRLWNERVQDRVARATAMLSQVKAVKMIGLEKVAANYLQESRETEIEAGKASRRWIVIIITAGGFSENLTAPLMIAGALFWTKLGSDFNPQNVFTILSVTTLIVVPLIDVLDAYSFAMSSVVCFKRIQEYLALDERTDFRSQDASAQEKLAQKDSASVIITEKDTASIDDQRAANRVVDITKADVSIHKSEEPVLRNVSIAIERHQRVMVVGVTGSGKSMLMRTLLGETHLAKGSIFVESGTVGFCDQTPWIQNKSVRENIIGQSPVDMAWYNLVLDACLLWKDMGQLEDSDNTVVGSNGGMLSGGQKHRVALARAVYSRSPYLFLDDVVAALDDNTASIIFSRLFGKNGLLKSCPMTVVMTTYSMSHLSGADQIILVEKGGQVTARPDLRDNVFKAKIQKIISKAATNQKTEDDGGHIISSPKAATREDPTKITKARQRGNLSIYKFYLLTFQFLALLAWFVVGFILSFAENFPDAYMNIWLVKDAKNELFFVGYAVIGAIAIVLNYYWVSLWFYKLVPFSSLAIYRKMVDTLTSSTLAFITSISHGVLINLFSQDMTTVTQALAFTFLRTALYVFKMIIRSGMVAASTKYTALVIPALFIVLFVLQIFYLRTSRQIRYLSLEAMSPLYAQLTETAEGLRHIRGFQWEPSCVESMHDLIDASHKPYYYMYAIERWLGLVTDLITLCVALILLGVTLFTELAVSSSTVGLSLVSLISFSSTAMGLIKNWTLLESSLGSLSRVKDFLRDTPQEHDPEHPTRLSPNWPSRGEVTMENVVARYNPKSGAPPALNDVSVTIPAGCKVGVIGRTGGGKSSFLMTLLKFLNYSGRIIIDDIDISTVAHHELRSKITTISQDGIEFDASVRSNLLPYNGIMTGHKLEGFSDGDLKKALEGVDLWDLVKAAGGLDTKMSKLNLSHGQMQLVCIARACLHNRKTRSKLVIIDEATSNLDIDTESTAQRVMNEAFRGCTVIAVAHRVETLSDADMYIRMKDGKIAK